MLEFLLDRESSLSLAMKLIYNMHEAEEIVDNETYYFNPFSDDEEMPSFWLKKEDIQIAWYKDNPDRGASANVESNAAIATYIIFTVWGVAGGTEEGMQQMQSNT